MIEEMNFFPDNLTDMGPFYLHMTGISYCDDTYHICRTNSSIYIFEYVICGKGSVLLNSQVYPVSKGDVYFLQKGSDHEYYADPKEPFTKIWVNVYGDLVESLIKVYNLSKCVVINNCGDEIYDLFKEMVEISSTKQELSQIFMSCSFKFFKLIYKISLKNSNSNSKMSIEALTLKQYLDNKIYSPITKINELCKCIYRSPVYVTNLFKHEFGITPYKYLLDKKIDTAKYLLKNSPLSIKEIALKLGFTDQHYFTNLFKNRTGINPSCFRKQET